MKRNAFCLACLLLTLGWSILGCVRRPDAEEGAPPPLWLQPPTPEEAQPPSQPSADTTTPTVEEERISKLTILTNKIDGSKLVLIPGGEFMMGGCEKGNEAHQVHVDSFYLGQYEVTNAQYKKFVDANPAWRKDRIKSEYHNGPYLHHWESHSPSAKKEDHPVVCVSWYAARAYCEWAGCRMPTEAEWEYTAQGGKSYDYGTATGEISHDLANYGGMGDEENWMPVGSFPPNPFGIHDLCGNVWEWCSSLWMSYPYDPNDGRENYNTNNSRVLRGGCCGDPESLLGARWRHSAPPKVCLYAYGFRVARDTETQQH